MKELYLNMAWLGSGLIWAAFMQRRIPQNVVINGYFYRLFLMAITAYLAYMLVTQDIQYPLITVLLSAIAIFTLYGVVESFRFKLYFDEQGFRYRKGWRWSEHRFSDIVNISHIRRDKAARSLFYEMEGASFSISAGMSNANHFYEYVRRYSDLTGLETFESLDN